ncbi:MAG: hypothetical protein ABEI31_02620, partial [Halodesulfurarchaeum sp.]
MEDSRGQIILVAALGIAVTLVALAVIVNTVIFTENLATRNTVEGQEAIMVERSSEEAVANLMAYANKYNNSSYSAVKGQFKRDVKNLSVGQNVHALSEGGFVNVSVVEVNNGTRIAQTQMDTLHSAGGQPDWTLAKDVTATRWFLMNFGTATTAHGANISVSKSNSEWIMNISYDGSRYRIRLRSESGAIASDTFSGTPLLINVTGGMVNGN